MDISLFKIKKTLLHEQRNYRPTKFRPSNIQHDCGTIDTWSIELSEKNDIVTNLKNEWQSKRNPYNHFSWALNADESYISTCIWDWIKNNNTHIQPLQTAFKSLEEVMQHFNQVSTSEYELEAIKNTQKIVGIKKPIEKT
ncbi:hypothetical protein QK899_11630 [Pseudomonas sp. AR5]|nr:hypothetical protein QK899_11630 [Pseudomonas sp. AR5]